MYGLCQISLASRLQPAISAWMGPSNWHYVLIQKQEMLESKARPFPAPHTCLELDLKRGHFLLQTSWQPSCVRGLGYYLPLIAC